jgi:hypothetical protein
MRDNRYDSRLVQSKIIVITNKEFINQVNVQTMCITRRYACQAKAAETKVYETQAYNNGGILQIITAIK